MSKKSFVTKMMSRTLLIIVVSFLCISASFAQDSVAEKMASAKTMFSPSFSSLDDVQRSKVVTFFDNCSKPEKEAILSYMVQAITDSLKADKKEFAINYIDYYRLIADPNDKYLGSLVVIEGKYYYEKRDASKLTVLYNYLNGIASKSSLDYSSELSKVGKLKNYILRGTDAMLGYWIVDDDISSEPPLYMKIEKIQGQLVVTLSMPMFSFNTYNILRDPDVMEKNNKLMEDFQNKKSSKMEDIEMLKREQEKLGIEMKDYFIFKGNLSSLECIESSPNSLSFFWASQKLKKGNEYLATGLRSGVRTISNNIIGELARSNSHSSGTSLFGSLGTIFGEAVLNALIDGVSTSKNTIRTISGILNMTGNNTLDADMYVDYFHATTEDSKVEIDSTYCKVKFIRYDLDDPYVSENFVFFDYISSLSPRLRKFDYLSNKEKKHFLTRHPEAKIRGSKFSTDYWEKIVNFNKAQYEELKKYIKGK